MPKQYSKISEVCDFIRGVSFTPKDLVSFGTDGAIACFRTKNVQQELDLSDVIYIPQSFVKNKQQILRDGDILISNANSKDIVGKCCYINRLNFQATLGGFIVAARAKTEIVLSRYLYYWMSSQTTQTIFRLLARQTTNIANLPMSLVGDLQIALPSLPEQERIVRLLDEAESLRTARQRAYTRMEQFIPSLFHEMFGDVEINDKKWKTKSLNELLSKIESGWSPVCLDRPVEHDEWGMLKLGALTYCEYDDTQNKAFPKELVPRLELEVKAGDVLFSRKNTHDLVAACVFVFETRPKLMLSDLTFRLCIRDKNELLPEYLWQVMIQPNKRKKIQTLATGAAAQMPNISKTRLLTIDIPVPPLALQREFAARVEAARGVQSAQARSAGRIEALYQSMLSRAFAGEL